MKSCWPIRAMPELLGRRKWSVLQEMSYKQRVLLDARLAQGADLEPDACRALAADLGLAFQQAPPLPAAHICSSRCRAEGPHNIV